MSPRSTAGGKAASKKAAARKSPAARKTATKKKAAKKAPASKTADKDSAASAKKSSGKKAKSTEGTAQAEATPQTPAPKARKKKRVPHAKFDIPLYNERDVGPDELEFIEALNAYREQHERLFPKQSEILHVLRFLGYRKVK